jgi:hypothetical protein
VREHGVDREIVMLDSECNMVMYHQQEPMLPNRVVEKYGWVYVNSNESGAC